MMNWYIQLLNPDGSTNGAPLSTASLGIEDIEYDLNNLAADTWTFTAGGQTIDAAALWPYGQLLAIQDATGARVAFGRIEPWSRQGTPETQNHLGRLVNPWWYLTRKIYQQRYSVAVNNYPVVGQVSNPTYQVFTTPRVVLNVLFNGQNQGFFAATTGQQIADAINWAIAQGAPIQLGTMDPAMLPFSDFKKGIFCSDVIKLMFRKEPDFVCDWDYSTMPFPTMHCRKMQSFTPLLIDLTDTTRRDRVEIRERPDWKRSFVNICYDQTNQQNGQSFLQITNDIWPNPIPAGVEASFGGVDLYCDLTGSVVTASSMTCSLASLPLDITSLATWQRWKPDLAAGTVSGAVILTGASVPPADVLRPEPVILPRDEYTAGVGGIPVSVPLDPTCIYEVVDGEWADWLGINGQRVRCTAWAFVTQANGHSSYEQIHAEPTLVSVNTGGIKKDFTSANSNISQYAEVVPVGLAKAMWTSWNNLAIEGSFTNTESAVGVQKITRANCLNFLTANPGQAGRPDWRNVNALVQRIGGSFLRGTTQVSFGAPLTVTGNDLIDAVRATRYRVTTLDLGYLFGGPLGGGTSPVRFGRKTHARGGQSASRHTSIAVVSQAVQPGAGDPVITHDGTTGMSTWTSGGGGSVQIDPRVKGSDNNYHALTVREEKVCVTIGGALKQRTVLVLASDIYQAPSDPA